MHQVFLSYAHADNTRLSAGARGWVTEFADHLQQSIRRAVQGDVKVWMDHRLEPQQEVDPTLRAALRDSACLVAMLSPRYLASKWCRGELADFLRHNDRSTDERIFLVETWPTDRQHWDAATRNLSAIPFWAEEFEGTAPMTLGWPKAALDGDKDYWRGINALAHSVAMRLSRTASPDVEIPKRGAVWIAAPAREAASEWLALGDALRQCGCEVLPAAPDQYATTANRQQFEELVRSDLARCRLHVQLMTRYAAPPPAWSDVSLDRLQRDAARREDQDFHRELLVWRAPEIDLDQVVDAGHRELLVGTVACGFEEFRNTVIRELDSLARPTAPPIVPARTSVSGALSILVAADRRDRELGEEVRDALFKLDVDTALIPEITQEQQQSEWREHYESHLVNSNALIIVYGRAPASWVVSQMLSAKKTLSSHDRETFGAILDGPPGTQPPHGIKSRAWLLLDCRLGVHSRVIADLVSAVGRAGPGSSRA